MNYSINVGIACDDKYAQYAGVVIASVLYNANKDSDLTFYILDGGISDANKENINSLKNIKDCTIKFIQINEDMFEDYKKIKTHEYISIATYYRLKLGQLLPDVGKILYFDCDTVVNTDLTLLFNTDMEDKVIAGVNDLNHRMIRKNPDYVNAGMLLMDLKKIREQNIEQEFLEYSKNNFEKIKTGDQQIINDVLKGRIKLLKPQWNVQISNFTNRSIYTNDPWIIHYVGKQKPWKFGNWNYNTEYYYKYLRLTPWAFGDKEKAFLKKSKLSANIGYLKYRPLFMFRPRFYKALYSTYIKPVLDCNKPIIKNNTFIVWEACSKSHAEVVPGFVKYLLDLGYNVSVIVHKNRIKEGLFARFNDKNLYINKITKKQAAEYLKKSDLSEISGLMITTVGKFCDSTHYEQVFSHFADDVDKHKLFFVEHESKHSIDAGTWDEWADKLIMLRQLDYKDKKTVVVNPHYFGDINYTPKNSDVTNFLTVGALQINKKDCKLIINAVKNLHEQGITNFKVTVVGKGNLKGIPSEIRKYFDIKGRLPFDKMYEEIEKADFMLTSYDDKNPGHIRYNTTGTSGNFQLVYGFLKPCIIIRSFAPLNGFDDTNSILYDTPEDYTESLIRGIKMSGDEYKNMQNSLKTYVDKLYNLSKENLKRLIDEQK